MPIAITPDQLAMQASIRDWAKQAGPVAAVRRLELDRAGPAQNRSGLASGGGGSESSLTAGYRLGTTRTVQPGVSGGPPFGLTANNSGGVRSSWPSAKGSSSGSMGSGARSWGDSPGAPPGRRERSPATIVLAPLSGSVRISGNAHASSA